MRQPQVALAIGLACMVWVSSPVARAEGPSVNVHVFKLGVVRGTGAVTVPVRVTCRGGTVLEALLTLSQDDQRVFGQGGISGIVCNGVEQWRLVQINALSGVFHRGSAFASAFMLVCDAAFSCAQGSDTGELFLLGRPPR